MRITGTALVTLALIAVANAITITMTCSASKGQAILGHSGRILCNARGSDGSTSRMEKSWNQLSPRIMSACENVGLLCAERDWQDSYSITLYFNGEKQTKQDPNATCTGDGKTIVCENSGTFEY